MVVSTKMENVGELIWDIEAGSYFCPFTVLRNSYAIGNSLFCLNPELASLFRHKVFNFD